MWNTCGTIKNTNGLFAVVKKNINVREKIKYIILCQAKKLHAKPVEPTSTILLGNRLNL